MKNNIMIFRRIISVLLVAITLVSCFAVSFSAMEVEDISTTDASLSTPKLTSVAKSGSMINFEWDKVPGAYGYRIFYKTDTAWKTIAETTRTSYFWNQATYGKTYIFTVRCVDEDGNFTSSFDPNGYQFSYMTDTPKINNITKSGPDVNISWDYVSGAYAYKVFFKNGTSWKTIATTTSNKFTWPYAAYDKEYIYTVRCVDKDDNFISSFDPNGYKFTLYRWDTATPKITSVSKESNAVRINWDKVSGAYGYKVFYKTETAWKTIATTTSNTYLWNGATDKKEYIYTVRCVDENDEFVSDYDKNGYSFTLDLSAVAMPKITSVSKESNAVRINWDKVAGAYGYKVFYKTETAWKTIATTTSNTYLWNDAIVDKQYIYTVRCVDKNGEFISDYDKNGYAFTLDSSTVATPKITSVSKESNAVRINWDKVTGAYGYKVFYKTETAWKTITTTTSNTYLWNGAIADKQYIYTVRCVDKDDNFISSFDSNGYAFTLTGVTITMPKIYSVTPSGSSVNIMWNAVPGAYGYKVFYKTDTAWKTIDTTTSNSYTWTSPTIGKNYIYTVRCVNSNGDFTSSFDPDGYAYTLTLATPKITSIKQDNLSVDITWGKVSGAYAYRVFYKTDTAWKTIGETTSNTFEFDFASVDKTYVYTVRCIDTSGNFTSSFDPNGYAFTTKSYFPLDTPRISKITQSGINLNISWNAVKGAEKYRVFYKNGSSWKTIDTVSSTSCTWSGASADREYIYTVRCLNSSGDWTSAYDAGGFAHTANEYLSLQSSAITIYKYSSYAIKPIANCSLNWSSSNNSVASVLSGVVSGQGNGSCTITCSTKDGKYSAKCSVTVKTGNSVYLSDYSATIPAGKTFYCKNYTSGVSWSSSDTSIATVSGGFIKAKSPGICVITASVSGGATSCVVTVSPAAPVRFAYTSPNCAAKNSTVSLIAITDTDRTDVKFNVSVGSSIVTVNATSKTKDGSNYIWKGTTSFSSAGTYNVTAYSKYDGVWSTCNDATTTAFVTSTSDYKTTVCANRRASDSIINLIANYEGFLPNIVDDEVAPGNWTVGYGRVIYAGEDFYNSLSRTEAYAYLVQTVNNDGYATKVNQFLVNNGVKFNQQQFDALVCFVYNCGTGVLSNDDSLASALLNCSSGSGGGTTTYYVDGSYVNFRTGPGTSYSVIKMLDYGTTLKILSTSNSSWYNVQLSDGTKGYISSSYVGSRTSGGSLDLNYVNKQNLINNFCQYHHAGGCLYGLLYRRIDEMEVFFYGDYDRNYGTYKYDINFRCATHPSFGT